MRIVHTDTARELLEAVAVVQLGPAVAGHYEPGESAAAPVVIQLPPSFSLPHFGQYDVSISVNGTVGARLTFYARPR